MKGVKVGSRIKITSPGDWKIPVGATLYVSKIYSWGVKGIINEKVYYAQWDEIGDENDCI